MNDETYRRLYLATFGFTAGQSLGDYTTYVLVFAWVVGMVYILATVWDITQMMLGADG